MQLNRQRQDLLACRLDAMESGCLVADVDASIGAGAGSRSSHRARGSNGCRLRCAIALVERGCVGVRLSGFAWTYIYTDISINVSIGDAG